MRWLDAHPRSTGRITMLGGVAIPFGAVPGTVGSMARSEGPTWPLSPQHHDAVLFDLDGVLTDTATLHATAWATTFNEWFSAHAPDAAAFTDSDYRRHVDGKPRYDGVRDFLASRNIRLPEGHPDDPPGAPTVCGLGNTKQETFNRLVAAEGVATFDDGVALLRSVVDAGIHTAVVSASKNCAAVVAAAGLDALLEVRVDGLDVEDGGIAGKPAPDSFVLAARRLGADPSRTVVIEDACAGVEAGVAGDFGLVVGVDRDGQDSLLAEAGADIVVDDLRMLAPLD